MKNFQKFVLSLEKKFDEWFEFCLFLYKVLINKNRIFFPKTMNFSNNH